MPIALRKIAPEEMERYIRLFVQGFGGRATEGDIEAERGTIDVDRTIAAMDGKSMVGTAWSFPTELTLPGATRIPAGAVAAVTVAPTHRRQGILRQMMTRQLGEIRERGEHIAILTASESGIYQRFGYGPATTVTTTEIHTHYAALNTTIEPKGALRFIELEEARDHVFPSVFERMRLTQPGEIARSEAFWRYFMRADSGPGGSGGLQLYVAYSAPDGKLEGALSYRFNQNWEQQMPNSGIEVSDFIATTLEARVALWRFCLSLDLVATVKLWRRPIEDPLRWLLADPRRLRALALREFVYVRPLSVPNLLEARRYSTSGKLVLEVRDDFIPDLSGRYLLDATPEGATCRKTTESAEVTLSMADLGSISLGGARLRTLHDAGRTDEHAAGAISRADLLFQSDPPPFCSTPF